MDGNEDAIGRQRSGLLGFGAGVGTIGLNQIAKRGERSIKQ